MSMFSSEPEPVVMKYKIAPSHRRIRWLALSSAAIGVALLLAVAAVIYIAIRSDRAEDGERAKCIADGGRIVPVHGGKYSAWICDLPRDVEVRP